MIRVLYLIYEINNNYSFFSIANVEEYAKKTKNNILSRRLKESDVKSCILAPVVKNNRLLGVLELVAKKKNQLVHILAHYQRIIWHNGLTWTYKIIK